MRIGVIGPPASVAVVQGVAANAQLPLSCISLPYAHHREAVPLLAMHRDEVDAFLFTGTTPFSFAMQHCEPEKPWGVLPRSTDALLCAMFKAVYSFGCDIRRVSVDSYDEEDLRAAFAEIGVPFQDALVLAHPFAVHNSEYLENLLAFHEDNVRSGRSDFCLSGVQSVYDALTAKGIAAAKPFATSEMILQQLQGMYIRHLAVARQEHRIAVISVLVRFSRERSLYGKSDMQFFQYKTKVLQEIHGFAQKIGATVEINDEGGCRIYSTESALGMETRDMTNLPLIRSLQKLDGVLFAVAGIGLGETPADAKYHADLGRDRAAATSRSGFFIVSGDHTFIGPIVAAPAKKQPVAVDRGLLGVSRKSGIGMERLYQIERAVRVHGLETVTPAELADVCAISRCTMNRIISKLVSTGHARVVGKQPSAARGRPNRLVQILF